MGLPQTCRWQNYWKKGRSKLWKGGRGNKMQIVCITLSLFQRTEWTQTKRQNEWWLSTKLLAAARIKSGITRLLKSLLFCCQLCRSELQTQICSLQPNLDLRVFAFLCSDEVGQKSHVAESQMPTLAGVWNENRNSFFWAEAIMPYCSRTQFSASANPYL